MGVEEDSKHCKTFQGGRRRYVNIVKLFSGGRRRYVNIVKLFSGGRKMCKYCKTFQCKKINCKTFQWR